MARTPEQEKRYQELLAKFPEEAKKLQEGKAVIPSIQNETPLFSTAPVDAKPVESEPLSAALSGAAQGATFGFSDEMGGALDAVLAGELSKYREFQKLREARNKELEENNGLAYFAGNVGGGLATAPLLGSLGIAGKIAGAGGKIAGPAVEALLAGKTSNIASNALGKGLNLAIEGGALGGLYGAGSSEHGIDKPLELAGDVYDSAKMGTVIAPAIGAVGGLIGGLKKTKLADAFEEGQEVGSRFSKGFKDKVTQYREGLVNDPFNDIALSKEANKTATNEAMNIANEMGVKVPVSKDIAQEISGLLDDDDLLKYNKSIKSRLEELVDNQKLTDEAIHSNLQYGGGYTQKQISELTQYPISKLKSLSNDINNSIEKLTNVELKSSSDRALLGKLTTIRQLLENQMRASVPEYGISVNTQKQLYKNITDTLMESEHSSRATNEEMFDKLRDMLSRADLKGDVGESARRKFNIIKKNINEMAEPDKYSGAIERLNDVDPFILEAAKARGNDLVEKRLADEQFYKNKALKSLTLPEEGEPLYKSAKNFIKKMDTSARKLAVSRAREGYDPNSEVNAHIPSGIGGFIERLAIGLPYKTSTELGAFSKTGVAQKAGTVAKAAFEAPQQISKKLYDLTESGVSQLAKNLFDSDNKSMKMYGEKLAKAIENKDVTGRNIVLFQLLQNEDFKSLFQEGK